MTTTQYSPTAVYEVFSSGTTGAIARAGTGSFVVEDKLNPAPGSGVATIGQVGFTDPKSCSIYLVEWTVPDYTSIVDAFIDIWDEQGDNGVDVEAYLFDWGGGAPPEDASSWLTPTQLSALTLMLSFPAADLGADWPGYSSGLQTQDFLDYFVGNPGYVRMAFVIQNHRLDQDAAIDRVLVGTDDGSQPPLLYVNGDAILIPRGNQPAASGALVALFANKLLQGDQPNATGGITPSLVYGAPGRERRLPIPAGTARVTTPRPASGSIRTRRDGVL